MIIFSTWQSCNNKFSFWLLNELIDNKNQKVYLIKTTDTIP